MLTVHWWEMFDEETEVFQAPHGQEDECIRKLNCRLVQPEKQRFSGVKDTVPCYVDVLVC